MYREKMINEIPISINKIPGVILKGLPLKNQVHVINL